MNIKEIRRLTGLSQTQFAKKYHINLGTLQNWEKGIYKTPDHFLYILQRLVDEVDYKDKATEQGWFESNLPEYLQIALMHFKRGQKKLENGEQYNHYDIDFCELQSSINVAQVEQEITDQQASYFRSKYLGIE